MTRRLIVLRHAHATAGGPGLPDHARPLDAAGRAEALAIGHGLVAAGWIPSAVRTSDAVRAVQTWHGVATTLPEPVPSERSAALYGAGWARATTVLTTLPDAVATALVVGHNPGWEELVAEACGTAVSLGTAHAALLQGAGADWAEALAPSRWRLVGVLRP